MLTNTPNLGYIFFQLVSHQSRKKDKKKKVRKKVKKKVGKKFGKEVGKKVWNLKVGNKVEKDRMRAKLQGRFKIGSVIYWHLTGSI